MALMQVSFKSETLRIAASMNVIVPQPSRKQLEAPSYETVKYPTLYLLHGMSDDHSTWLRHTSIERYAAAYGLAVVMPAVNRSFYADMAAGADYWSFVSEELPVLARSFFPLSDKREDNFACGNSMGGYGAFKMGLRCPDKFAAVASLSGSMNVAAEAANSSGEWRNIFGKEQVKDTDNDLFYLLSRAKENGIPIPALYQCCGTEDFLYKANQAFLAHARELGVDLTYEEEPAKHEWGYWDTKIKRVLEWLPLKR